MTGNVIVGFSSAAPGTASGLAPSSGSATAGDGGGNLFQSLLDLVSGTTNEAAVAIGHAVITQLTAAVQPQPDGQLPGPLPGTSDETAALPPGEPELPDETGLLTDLLEALAALDTTLEAGEPIDPTLRGKLEDMLDRFGSLLDLDLPDLSEPALPDAMAALATPAMPGALPPGPQSGPTISVSLPPASMAPPPADGAPVPTPMAPDARPGTALPAIDTPAPAGQAVTAPSAGAAADTDLATAPPTTTTAATPSAAEAPPPPDSAPARLALRLENLAATLQPLAPELSRALDRLASRLLAGELPAATLARLGIAPDFTLTDPKLAQALESFLQQPPATTAPVTPKPFLRAELPLPATMTQLPAPAADQQPQAETRPPPASAATADALEMRVEPEPAVNPRLAGERPTNQPTRDLPAPAAGELAPAADTRPAMPASGAGMTVAASATLTATADVQALQATYQAPARQLNLPQLAFEVARQFQAGNSRFQIRLDPPDLGRIDVRMDLDRDGNVNARMVVERVETLDLMQRDQRALERALAQAGLDGGKTSLEFSLRQNPFSQPGQGDAHDRPGHWAGTGEAGTEPDDDLPPAEATRYRGTAAAGGLNLFV